MTATSIGTHSLAAHDHLHLVAEMMSESASDDDAVRFLDLLRRAEIIPTGCTIGDLAAIPDDVFYRFADEAENGGSIPRQH